MGGDISMFNLTDKDYEQIFELVNEALNDVNTFDLAQALAETNEGQTVTQIVAEQLYQSVSVSNEVDYNINVHEYLLLSLEDSDKLLQPEAFENEIEAEEQGYFWNDEMSKWIKLDFTKPYIKQ